MYYADIKETDVANGVGFGVSLFVSGCRGNCEGCFNKVAWDFNYGSEFTDKTMDKILELCGRPYVDFFAVLGGDPLEPENKDTVLSIISRVRSTYPNLSINIWTRFLYEDLIKDEVASSILDLCDELVDGAFVLSKKSLGLVQRGSSNQRIIDLNKTRVQGSLMLNEELMNRN